jgi:dTDP-4-amino-4,6-dideoxygalactose transaminase
VCRFYEATPTLEPDEGELMALVGPRTRALHLIHYLGFPQVAGRWRQWCDERGLLLIEDAAQAWLAEAGGQPLGCDGDLAIFCLYKTVGLPDGGVLVSRAPLEIPTGRGRLGARGLSIAHAWWLASRSSRIASVVERWRQPEPDDPLENPLQDFTLGNPASLPCRGTLLALSRIATPKAAAIRRSNYARLLAGLGDLVVPAFARLPTGASPFVFPIAVDNKPAILSRLHGRRISAVNLWSVPHPSLPVGSFPGAAALRARVVGLPVHQELRERDLSRMIESVRGALSA